jgi:hypothetical protein
LGGPLQEGLFAATFTFDTELPLLFATQTLAPS